MPRRLREQTPAVERRKRNLFALASAGTSVLQTLRMHILKVDLL
jgi:hypothetical protein